MTVDSLFTVVHFFSPYKIHITLGALYNKSAREHLRHWTGRMEGHTKGKFDLLLFGRKKVHRTIESVCCKSLGKNRRHTILETCINSIRHHQKVQFWWQHHKVQSIINFPKMCFRKTILAEKKRNIEYSTLKVYCETTEEFSEEGKYGRYQTAERKNQNKTKITRPTRPLSHSKEGMSWARCSVCKRISLRTP